MNVFEKINEARIRFQNANVKKSGKNSYAGYTYYELADILPAINKIAQELKFSCIVNFTPDLATLDFVDCEKNEKITFTSPMSSASLKGAMDVQNTGAVITYLKRYLYQNCFEIVENDLLDATLNPNEEKGENVDDLIQKVRARMNVFNDAQLDYANKAINTRNLKMLKDCLK
jgi:hypothetical protein